MRVYSLLMDYLSKQGYDMLIIAFRLAIIAAIYTSITVVSDPSAGGMMLGSVGFIWGLVELINPGSEYNY